LRVNNHTMPSPDTLPIDTVLPALLAALDGYRGAVLQAPPGAGKTTRVPLALLDAPWLAGGRIVMLEPRRLAARGAAARMAAVLGEAVGETVGYRVRMDSRVGPRTRIEVVTEGIFLRRIQADPELAGVAAVLFDEFHERNLDADLSLALALEVQGALRPELRLVAMSATLDGGPVCALLGGVPLVTSEGRAFPIETRFAEPTAGERIEAAMARTVRRALAEEAGGILAFLPGRGEIAAARRLLDEAALPAGVDVVELHGDLSLDAQDAAIRRPAAGRRKVVLATAIAETSLTIEGIRVVVDSGLARQTRFDPRSGMNRLETARVSRASADQRRGRAGRLEPGVCYRLWSEPADRALIAHSAPEILRADLVPLALELARWGAAADALRWLDPPPAAALGQGRELLMRLGALDRDGRITPHGRAMADLGVHPRLAHMLQRAAEEGCVPLASRIAALLGERDPLRGGPGRRTDADLRSRLELLEGGRDSAADRRTLARVREGARDLQRRLGTAPGGGDSGASPGRLLAMAYPDRIGQRRGPGLFRLSGGRGATLDEADPLAAAELLAVADLDAHGANARIFLAAPLTRAELEAEYAGELRREEVVEWDARDQAVLARRRLCFGALVLEDEALPRPPAEARLAALLAGIRQMGPGCLPWSAEHQRWRERVAFLRREDGGRWPDLSDAALMDSLEGWLAPWLEGVSRRGHLAGIDLGSALHGLLDWTQRQELDRLAPTHVSVPSGSRLPIDYAGDIPVLAVRLQEMFGLAQTPAVLGGRVPLLLHLLSPAQRPVQVTRDLAGFWASSYREVRKDLAGRYPRHAWPDDPLQAPPTARAKPRPR
jgi:ATP-dependent helicase HrpB